MLGGKPQSTRNLPEVSYRAPADQNSCWAQRRERDGGEAPPPCWRSSAALWCNCLIEKAVTKHFPGEHPIGDWGTASLLSEELRDSSETLQCFCRAVSAAGSSSSSSSDGCRHQMHGSSLNYSLLKKNPQNVSNFCWLNVKVEDKSQTLSCNTQK